MKKFSKAVNTALLTLAIGISPNIKAQDEDVQQAFISDCQNYIEMVLENPENIGDEYRTNVSERTINNYEDLMNNRLNQLSSKKQVLDLIERRIKSFDNYEIVRRVTESREAYERELNDIYELACRKAEETGRFSEEDGILINQFMEKYGFSPIQPQHFGQVDTNSSEDDNINTIFLAGITLAMILILIGSVAGLIDTYRKIKRKSQGN